MTIACRPVRVCCAQSQTGSLRAASPGTLCWEHHMCTPSSMPGPPKEKHMGSDLFLTQAEALGYTCHAKARCNATAVTVQAWPEDTPGISHWAGSIQPKRIWSSEAQAPSQGKGYSTSAAAPPEAAGVPSKAEAVDAAAQELMGLLISQRSARRCRQGFAERSSDVFPAQEKICIARQPCRT